MIYDRFILEKLLELIPLKTKEESNLLSELNSNEETIQQRKALNITQESLTALNKLRKQYPHSDTKQVLTKIKQNLLSKKAQENTIYLIYSLYSNIKKQNFEFDKIIDDKMAEIEFGISMTSLEIQIEELFKAKIDFNQIDLQLNEEFKEEREEKKEIQKVRQELGNLMKIISEQNEKLFQMKTKLESDTNELQMMNTSLIEEKKELLNTIKAKQKEKEHQEETYDSIISELNNKISVIDKDKNDLREENKALREEIDLIKNRLKILEELNKIPDSD